jgi:bifunctional non-homologous end joining protein LigD
MLAALDEAPLVSDRLVYEPKYDGIRTLVTVEPGGPGEPGAGASDVRLWSRLGNDKTAQFPDLVRPLRDFSRRLTSGVVLDGEIVALDADGEPAGFQRLQGRIHLTGERAVAAHASHQPVALILFDLLREGAQNLMDLPLIERRARLERMFAGTAGGTLRLSEFVLGDGRELYRRAAERGWEGLVAKNLDSRYASGRRSPEWRKLKILHRQECVVGGWTEPRGSRAHFGALLLGVWENGALEYVGHTGTGFTGAELDRLARRLQERANPRCPFRSRPPANERPHWVVPDLVVEVAFTEWTDDRRLRHPKYLGVRDDVRPEDVRREPATGGAATAGRATAARATGARPTVKARARASLLELGDLERAPQTPRRLSEIAVPRATARRVAPAPRVPRGLQALMNRVLELEARGGNGVITLPDGLRLEVGNLDKVFYPEAGITKGELMRYYVWASPFILPALAERPLVMRRFPNGVDGRAFYQQRAPEAVPPGVRVERLTDDPGVPSRLVGGSLASLLHMTQMAVVSQDPWLSRVPSLDAADHVALDLDPMPGVAFTCVLDVARWVHDELVRLGTPSMPKTSGAEGLHIYIPLPSRTEFEAGRLFCEIIATIVADRHPRVATVQRAVTGRGRTVYIDYLQNIRGKTLATAYSARATPLAGASAPLTWDEVHAGVDRRHFTIRTLPERVRAVGDLWAALRRSPGADLGAILKSASITPPPRRSRR